MFDYTYAADQRGWVVGFCSVGCHLGGMEAISTTDSGNEAEPQENYQHTSFASPLETPITLEQPANVPQTICHIKMHDIAAASVL